MYKLFVDDAPKKGETIKITGDSFFHIKNVLRMKIGEELSLYCNDNSATEYRCGIERFEDGAVFVSLRFIKDAAFELDSKLYLFQCLPKGDKTDLILQKAVELGAYAIVLVQSARCIAKIAPEKAAKKLERYNRICLSAAQQCGRNIIPKVLGIFDYKHALEFSKSLDRRFIPYEMETDLSFTKRQFLNIKRGESVAIFIGPEGGFCADEIDLARDFGVVPISLGRRILRTETAGMAVLSILGYLLD